VSSSGDGSPLERHRIEINVVVRSDRDPDHLQAGQEMHRNRGGIRQLSPGGYLWNGNRSRERGTTLGKPERAVGVDCSGTQRNVIVALHRNADGVFDPLARRHPAHDVAGAKLLDVHVDTGTVGAAFVARRRVGVAARIEVLGFDGTGDYTGSSQVGVRGVSGASGVDDDSAGTARATDLTAGASNLTARATDMAAGPALTSSATHPTPGATLTGDATDLAARATLTAGAGNPTRSASNLTRSASDLTPPSACDLTRSASNLTRSASDLTRSASNLTRSASNLTRSASNLAARTTCLTARATEPSAGATELASGTPNSVPGFRSAAIDRARGNDGFTGSLGVLRRDAAWQDRSDDD